MSGMGWVAIRRRKTKYFHSLHKIALGDVPDTTSVNIYLSHMRLMFNLFKLRR